MGPANRGTRKLGEQAYGPFPKLCTLMVLCVLIAGTADASHYRASSAFYTVDDAGLLTVEVTSAWRAAFVEAPVYEVWTGPGSTATFIGTMTLQSTVNPLFSGTEFGGAQFIVRKDIFTLDLSGQPTGTYYARWTRGNRVAGINNAPEAQWSSELTVIFNGVGAGLGNGGPVLPPATIDIVGRTFPYRQNLNSSDPDGSPVFHEFIGGTNGGGDAAPDYGPTTDIPGLALDPSTGIIAISAIDTTTLTLGRWVYKIRVTDGSGATAERDVMIIAQDPLGNNPPVLGPIGPQSIPVNTALDFTVFGTDPDGGQLLTVRGTSLPVGASFPETTSSSPVSSDFSWTPPSGSEGIYKVFFEIFDDATTILIDTELVEITVSGANSPPTLNPIGDQTVVNGSTLSFTISGTDPNPDTLTYSAFFLPAGATFTPGTQMFSWTPSPAQYDQTFQGVTFRVTDSGTPNLFDEEAINIVVGAGNAPPVIAAIADQMVVAGNLLSFAVNVTDPNAGQTITLSPGAGGLPPGATFPSVSGLSPQSSTFNWTPTVADVGNHVVNFRAADNASPILSVELPVNIVVTAPLAPPVIVGDPLNTTVDYDDTAVFTVTAAGPGTLTYQWQKNTVNISDSAKYSGTLTRTLVVFNCKNADQGNYRCVVTNTSSVNSNPGVLTVTDPAIKAHPQDLGVQMGSTANFSVVAVGSILTYQWYKVGSPDVLLSGETGATLSITNAQLSDEGDYYCIVSGADAPVQSIAATLDVGDPVFVVHPQTQTVLPGDTVVFNVVVAGTAPILYQWRKGGVNLSNGGRFSGVDTPTLTITNAMTSDDGNYLCRAIGQNIVDSDEAALTVGLTLIITQNLSNKFGVVSLPLTWSITVAGAQGPVTYQWMKQNTSTFLFEPVTDSGVISGATTDTLTISTISFPDQGLYQVQVADSAEATQTSPATLTVFVSVPAMGGAGLAALLAMAALGGALALRRRK